MKDGKPHYLGALLVILAPHQGSIILWKRRKKNIRDIENNQFIEWMNTQFWFLFHPHPILSYNSANGRQISKTDSRVSFCFLSACNLSRKEGSTAPEPGQTSGQFQQSTAISRPVWSLNRRPQGRRGGNWCQHSCLDCRYCQFPLIAVEVPPSALRQGKHLALIVLRIYKPLYV